LQRRPKPPTYSVAVSSKPTVHSFDQAIKRAESDGLHAVNVKGDGACLFRAVGLSHAGTEDIHLDLRKAAVNYLKVNEDFFIHQYGSLDPDENLTFDNYLKKISNASQEVGELVLYALANVLKIPIAVYNGDHPPFVYSASHNTGNSSDLVIDRINIIYKDSLNSSNHGHYMALQRTHQPSSSSTPVLQKN